MRQLATIRRIATIGPITGADKILVATLVGLGWEFVIKKDEYQVGQQIIYIECDSKLPDLPCFAFLKDEKRPNRPPIVKIRRFRGQVSQGLVMPLSILPEDTKIEEGLDVSNILGITKYDRQLIEEAELTASTKNHSKVLKFFMGYKAFRYIYFKLNSHDKGNFPAWLSKTDEDRVQVCMKLLREHGGKSFYVSEKLDGQSATYFLHKSKRWGLPCWLYGVCSRNIWLKSKGPSNYWAISDKYGIEQLLRKDGQEAVIQGECCGPKIQGNKYKLNELDFFVFNVKIDGRQLGPEEMAGYCLKRGLKTVPILDTNYSVPAPTILKEAEGDIQAVYDYQSVVKTLVAYSVGNSVLEKTKREGVVVRLNENPKVSFKVINPEFLLAEKDEE